MNKKELQKELEGLEHRIEQLECEHHPNHISIERHSTGPGGDSYQKLCKCCGKKWYLYEKEYLTLELEKANHQDKITKEVKK